MTIATRKHIYLRIFKKILLNVTSSMDIKGFAKGVLFLKGVSKILRRHRKDT